MASCKNDFLCTLIKPLINLADVTVIIILAREHIQTGLVAKKKLWRVFLGEEDQSEIQLVYFSGASLTLKHCPVAKRSVQ